MKIWARRILLAIAWTLVLAVFFFVLAGCA